MAMRASPTQIPRASRHPAGDVCATGTTTAAPIAAKAACTAV